MTIFYNPAYSSSPYREGTIEFDNLYCGDFQLMQRLLFFSGVAYVPFADEARLAHYHQAVQTVIKEDSPFYESFKTDSLGMSRTVLAWRDALVEVGWNLKSYQGKSAKMVLLRDVEPEEMPRGNADYWHLLIQLAETTSLLPQNARIVVTCSENELKPHIAHILQQQRIRGGDVDFAPITLPVATGNLGKIQQTILSSEKQTIHIDSADDTFNYLKFSTEDEILQYIATSSVEKTSLYYCTKTKRLDNTLKMLGKPTIGSVHGGASQVAQLFILGNGLFEAPLNIHRLIDWLNTPVSPLPLMLRRALSNALVNTGGVENAEWNAAKEGFVNTIEDPKEQTKALKLFEELLPLSQEQDICVARVVKFNTALCKWATKELMLKTTHYHKSVLEQLDAVKRCCISLIQMLENAPQTVTFQELQRWCLNLMPSSTFVQYEAEVHSHTMLSTMGDLHSTADKVVWVAAEDTGAPTYPFEMLNNTEFEEVKETGAQVYSRSQHTHIYQATLLRMLLNAKSLTIIEADKCGGVAVKRHPLVLQLEQCIKGGLQSVKKEAAIADLHFEEQEMVNNQGESPTMVHLDSVDYLKERHELYDNPAKKPESFSSIDQLIQHPFTYVCERYAHLKNSVYPSATNLHLTKGNVAHLVIEKFFSDSVIQNFKAKLSESYDEIFKTSVNEKGLLLCLPEHSIELNQLKLKMKDALDRLYQVISDNKLTVVACEYDFPVAPWKEVGEGVQLASRADMLLKDETGGFVIFDFKYTDSKTRKEEVKNNCALQLEVYRYMAKQCYGQRTPVRVAYILLPEVTILTADCFKGVDAIQLAQDRANKNVMLEAAHSYKFRWKQLKQGKIERQEGTPIGTAEYAEGQNLFPLSEYKGNYSDDRYKLDYKNLK